MVSAYGTHLAAEQIPAHRGLVEELAGQGLLTPAARDCALQWLYPNKNWGLWISRLLLVVGVSLVLSGIIYFFAFNWVKIGAMTKLGSIEIALLGCLIGTYGYGLERSGGKILLLSASVLVGVFLAVFGQIYQTGTDAYNLFMAWALLIAGWVVIAEYAALWALWLAISNIFLVFFWDQVVMPGLSMEMLLPPVLAVFNLAFLGAREYFVQGGVAWLADRWTRMALVIPVLVILLIDTIWFIMEPNHATSSVQLGAVLGIVVHPALYMLYRYILPDMRSLSAVFLSGCMIAESAGFKVMSEIFQHADAALFLLAGFMTLGIFTFAIGALRHIAKAMEVYHVR